MQTDHSTHVTVLTPASHQKRCYLLGEDDLLVGRAESCDLRFDDPYLSRVHAKLEVRFGRLRVRDLGSSGGTWVNDRSATGVVDLHDGDIVTMGRVRLRVSSDESVAPVRPTVGASGIGPASALDPAVRYDVGDQRAATINNIGRDQYSAYIHQRESFLREIAATRTRARWLLWAGFIVFVTGFGIELFGSMNYMRSITGMLDQGFGPSSRVPETLPSMGGFQLAFVGAGVVAIGVVLFVVGLVLHVVAASRRKRVDREAPLRTFSDQV